MKDSNERIFDLIEKIKNLLNKEANGKELIIENLEIDLDYLLKKYNKKLNPRYSKKYNLDRMTILSYTGGINFLLKEGFDEKLF